MFAFFAACEDEINEAVNTALNGESWNQADVLQFSSIPAEPSDQPQAYAGNSMNVVFDEPVTLNIIQVSAPEEQSIPEELTMIIIQSDGQLLTKDPISMEGSRFVVPDGVSPVLNITIVITSSSTPSFQISVELLGCVSSSMLGLIFSRNCLNLNQGSLQLKFRTHEPIR